MGEREETVRERKSSSPLRKDIIGIVSLQELIFHQIISFQEGELVATSRNLVPSTQTFKLLPAFLLHRSQARLAILAKRGSRPLVES